MGNFSMCARQSVCCFISSIARISIATFGLGIFFVQAASAQSVMPFSPARAENAFNWSGFYIGGQFGSGWGTIQSTQIAPGSAYPVGFAYNSSHPRGVLGGIYGGFNYQFNNPVVVGIDVDYSWADLSGSAATLDPTGAFNNIQPRKVNWISTVTGRVGYAVNNWLIFGKGGWAWARETSGNSVFNIATGALVAGSIATHARNGWTIGAGVEWAFARNWVAKLEYDYIRFSSLELTGGLNTLTGAAITVANVNDTTNIHVAKVGVSYLFNWGRDR